MRCNLTGKTGITWYIHVATSTLNEINLVQRKSWNIPTFLLDNIADGDESSSSVNDFNLCLRRTINVYRQLARTCFLRVYVELVCNIKTYQFSFKILFYTDWWIISLTQLYIRCHGTYGKPASRSQQNTQCTDKNRLSLRHYNFSCWNNNVIKHLQIDIKSVVSCKIK